MNQHDYFDFNSADDPKTAADVSRLKQALLDNLQAVLFHLFPAGKVKGNTFLIGDIAGNPGQSLKVDLCGEKIGLWYDFAADIGGDIIELWACSMGRSARTDFQEVIADIGQWLGEPSVSTKDHSRSSQSVNSTTPQPKVTGKAANSDGSLMGPPSAQWDYHDERGDLIARIYRYDTEEGKSFQPWDVKAKKHRAPTPRPLYNQPDIANADTVILVEGEKCAAALIDRGFAATTAMGGANAPVEKTDWSPLQSKHVLIWPDNDEPGMHYAEKAADACQIVGAQSVTILVPPEDKPEKWDAADAIEEGFDIDGFIATAARIEVDAPADEELSQEMLIGADWTTEEGISTLFTRLHSDNWRYCAQWGKWLFWSGNRWYPDQVLRVMHHARQICRLAAEEADSGRLKGKLASSSTISAIEKIARSHPQHAAIAEIWDADYWALNTPDGVVNLKTGDLVPNQRQDYMTKITTATPRGHASRWLEFLADITGEDDELMSYLQRVVGYCLTGVTSEHALFFLYGTGANGKSVFVNVLATILGDYAANAPMETFMDTRGERHPTDLAGLRGARFVSSIETEQGRRWNESKVKAITGGDKISARFMRQDFFEYLPQFKLLIAGNHKPSIRNVDEAMKRRLHLIPFTITVPPHKRDGKLTEKLLKERDGILQWAVDGCLYWQKYGLMPPKAVMDATEEYFEAEDALGQWMEERCVTGNEHREGVSELFDDWRDWADKAGEYVGSVKRFSEQLTTRKFEKSRRHGGSRVMVGIALRPKAYRPYSPHSTY